MSHYSPRARSSKKVYIARKRWGAPEGIPISIGPGGETVQVVDNPALANEVVVVHIDGRPVDRATAITLTKAALKDQKREEKGKKTHNVVEQVIADISAPQRSKAKRKGKRGGFSWRNWAAVGCVAWIVLVIAAGAPWAILFTPLIGPIFGWIGGGMLAIVFDDRW